MSDLSWDDLHAINRSIRISYPTEPEPWRDSDTKPFRCAYCGKMVMDGDGKWVKRDDYPASAMPGQFMAVHRVECRWPRRWWKR